MKLGDLFIKLGLKSEEFNQGVNKAKGGLSGFGTLAKSIGGMLVAAFSVRSMVNFFTTSVKLASEQIAVENRLAAALRANGKEVEGNMEKYKRFASALQRVTTVGDETTLGLIQLAVTMQSKAPDEAAKMAIGLSKALNVDLQTAVRMAVMAQNGHTDALRRQIPALRTATTDAEKMAAVQQTVATGMAIAADEANTAAGKFAQLKNAWGDLKEVIGSGILSSESIKQDLDDWTTLITIWQSDHISGWQKFLSSVSKKVMDSNAEILKSYQELGPDIEATLAVQRGYMVAMGETEADRKLAESLKKIKENQNKAKESTEDITEATVNYGRTITEIEKEITDLKDTLKGYGEFQTGEIQSTLRQIEANEKLLKSLTELKKAREENRAVGAIQPGKQFEGTLTARKGQYGRTENAFMQDIPGIDPSVVEEIRKYEDAIKAVKIEIENLTFSLSTYTDAQAADKQATLAQIAANEKLISNLEDLKEAKKSQLSPLDTSQLDDMTAYMQANIDKAKAMNDELLSNFTRFKEDFAMLVADFGVDVIDQFGSAIGELVATGDFPADFGKNILASIGQFISTLGKMLIGLGIASEAFQALLKSAFTSAPAAIAAIAAGAALVAMGGAISSYARSRASGGASGGGGGAQGMYNQQMGIATQPTISKTQLFLKGDDFYISQTRNEFKRGLIG
jgi:hypothetical protein